MSETFAEIIAQKAQNLKTHFPQKIEQFDMELNANKDIQCLWHKRNHPGHKGNFGLMGQCLDCMEKIQNGRCEIDVKNFDFDVYWQVKKFWEKVDIRNPDECWPWTGATKKNNTETVAYMPSPFHNAKTQSAARVAFWTARGYTGKLRLFHQEGCDILCCNPLHLRIRAVESIPDPSKISEINLSYGNIFEHARANNLEKLETKLQIKSDHP